ncbi:hypothetical protein I4U23_004470 [Adineta vaga]|nr:hypothetical protein I4U23_004470 [Adineta vaga]
MATWIFITQMYACYAGTLLFCMSLFDCIMNTIVFTADRSYRTKPCTFFLIIAAIMHSIHLFFATLMRILATGFDRDLSGESVAWCKIKYATIFAVAGISLTCQWLATVDQFFMTSRSARLRRFSNIKGAYCIAGGVAIFWIAQSIPFLFYADLRSNICNIYDKFWQLYLAYVGLWGFYIILPVTMMIIFGTLGYRNMKALGNMRQLQSADRQLTYMICGEIALNIGYVVPYAIFYAYSLASASVMKSQEQRSIEYLVNNIINFNNVFGAGVS